MVTEIKLIDARSPAVKQEAEPENWYAEPFTKRTACRTPGQCGGDCDCGCPYNTLTEVERLPLIEEIAQIFPNEWLAFITSAAEDEEIEPIHGKLVAHSPHPDEVYDAVNTILWNQHVYIFFNGDFEAMQASYGAAWAATDPPARRTASGPQQAISTNGIGTAPLPDKLLDLVYSAVDLLYADLPNLNETIRRLRLARVRAVAGGSAEMLSLLDQALDLIEGPLPRLDEVIWLLEEGLAEVEQA